MRRLVLIRHGESVWNAEGRIQGQACNGLSEIGLAQARHTAKALAETYPNATLISSDIYRTQQTIAPLNELLSVTPVFDPRLRERHLARGKPSCGPIFNVKMLPAGHGTLPAKT